MIRNGQTLFKECMCFAFYDIACTRLTKCLTIIACVLALSNCANTESYIPATAERYDLQEAVVPGGKFQHKVFSNKISKGDYIHVYVAGDGVPWKYRFFVASNPTPKGSTTLHMVGREIHSAIYLGRPCYHELYQSENCQSSYWTNARFAEDVVSSMVLALNSLLAQRPNKKVILFGFSGGGALVMLMAPHVPQVKAVVTVVGNLNSRLWTQEHRYSRMKRSLNPYDQASLPAHIRQIHIVGGQDNNITRRISQSYVDKHGGEIWNYPSFGHSCCWLDAWPGILHKLRKTLALN